MKFGVREIAEVVLRAKSKQKIGKRTFYRNDPVIYFYSLTTSSLEGSATTNYINGGRGNARLMAWEGERTLTFSMTDALISPESFMILSGAGLIDADTENDPENGKSVIYVHTTSQVQAIANNTVILPKVACWSHSGEMAEGYYHDGADIFIMALDGGEISGEPCIPVEQGVAHGRLATKEDVNKGDAEAVGDFIPDPANPKVTKILCTNHSNGIAKGSVVLVDYYVKRTAGVKQIEITPDKFGGYFYLEGSTLFRRESDGKDLPAEIVIPKVKIQSNFTFTMASSGDPSTFDFTMDAFPDYTKFDGTKKVLAIMQIVESDTDEDAGDDFERRPHCDTKAGAETLVPKADEDVFDHWKTYGEEGHFAAADKDGYYADNDFYPDPDKRDSVTFMGNRQIKLATGSEAGSFKVNDHIVANAYKDATVSVETDIENPTITMDGDPVIDKTFTMPDKDVEVDIQET